MSVRWSRTVSKPEKRKGGHRMSDWSIIPTQALVEAENLLNDIGDSRDFPAVYLMTKEIKERINEAVSCNVKPEGTK